MERIDVRSLTIEGRQMLRRMVVRLRKQSGMRVEELAKVSGAHPTTIKGWLARARKEGENGLEEKRRGRPVGACRKLTLAAEAWIRDPIVQGNPQQLKMPFALGLHPATSRQKGVGAESGGGPSVAGAGLSPPTRSSGPRGRGDLLGG